METKVRLERANKKAVPKLKIVKKMKPSEITLENETRANFFSSSNSSKKIE